MPIAWATSASGAGLGLPIARELTRQWGGSVTLSNRDGKGLGLASEPITAGEALAPRKSHSKQNHRPPTKTTSSPQPTPRVPTTPSDAGHGSDDELEADD